MTDEVCRNCKWYAAYEGVCCNGKSEWRADFRDGYDGCPAWERGSLSVDGETE